jgi:hypothetical protein
MLALLSYVAAGLSAALLLVGLAIAIESEV